MLDGINKVHFVGIGGAGMSALAKILVEKGYQVSGSDVKESVMTGVLRDLGARIFIGQKAENVHGAEAIVISTAIREENPEVVEAKKLGLRRLHRSDLNAYLINNCKGIAVAGAHGKTTTTSMLGVALDYEGVSPSIIIGGEVDYLGSNAKLGKSDYLVSEADESDGTFLKYYPYVGIVTNVENDHMDHYGTMENIIKAFTQFLGQIRPEGFGVVCFDNENIRNIVKENKDNNKFRARIISYAIECGEADYQAANIESSVEGTSFDVIHKGENLGKVKLHVPGRHNVLNAMAAVVTGLQLGLTVAQMAEGLTMFNGAKRRFQTKGKVDGIYVMVIGYIGVYYASFLYWQYFTRKHVPVRAFQIVKDIIPYLGASLIAIAIASFVLMHISNIYIIFALKIIVVAIIYAAILWIGGSTIFKDAIRYMRH